MADEVNWTPFSDVELENRRIYEERYSNEPHHNKRWLATVRKLESDLAAARARVASLEEMANEPPAHLELEAAKEKLSTWSPVVPLHDADGTIDVQDRDDGHSHHYVPSSLLSAAREQARTAEGSVARFVAMRDRIFALAGGRELFDGPESSEDIVRRLLGQLAARDAEVERMMDRMSGLEAVIRAVDVRSRLGNRGKCACFELTGLALIPPGHEGSGMFHPVCKNRMPTADGYTCGCGPAIASPPTPMQDEVGETVATMVDETLAPLPAPTVHPSGTKFTAVVPGTPGVYRPEFIPTQDRSGREEHRPDCASLRFATYGNASTVHMQPLPCDCDYWARVVAQPEPAPGDCTCPPETLAVMRPGWHRVSCPKSEPAPVAKSDTADSLPVCPQCHCRGSSHCPNRWHSESLESPEYGHHRKASPPPDAKAAPERIGLCIFTHADGADLEPRLWHAGDERPGMIPHRERIDYVRSDLVLKMKAGK